MNAIVVQSQLKAKKKLKRNKNKVKDALFYNETVTDGANVKHEEGNTEVTQIRNHLKSINLNEEQKDFLEFACDKSSRDLNYEVIVKKSKKKQKNKKPKTLEQGPRVAESNKVSPPITVQLNDLCTKTAFDGSNERKSVKIVYTEYESELQMPDIMQLIQKDLSEPYSIYTYRYFINNWPKLCFLATHDSKCVGAIVCKLDMHKVVSRGYIAMLAVDKNYRKMKIGTTLVQKAIEVIIIYLTLPLVWTTVFKCNCFC